MIYVRMRRVESEHNEKELQDMLDILNNWCVSNNMSVNATKSNVMHFRPNSISRTTFRSTYGLCDLQIIDKYKYLGLVLNEFLDLSMTAKLVAQSASRALGLLIAKCKSAGGCHMMFLLS